MKRALLIILVLFLIVPFIYAQLDFEIISLSKGSQGDYVGEKSYFNFEIGMIDTSTCYYDCEYYNDINPTDRMSFRMENNNPTKKGFFSIDLSSNQNVINGIFYVSCTRTGWLGACGGTTKKEKSFSTNIYGYNGDEDCQSGKESCATATTDCSCSKEGKSSIGKDIKQCIGTGLSASCQTYCGNGLCENDESCSICSTDCKKCDGLSCVSPTECKGGYCVNEKCSSKPYVENDGICNTGFENCKNSVNDCACKSSERCSQTAQCETFCGNGICEQEEAGKCKEDCQWCGDGICNGNDNCKNCNLDCGICKEENKPSLIGSFLNNAENQKNTEIQKADTNVTDVQPSGIIGNVISD